MQTADIKKDMFIVLIITIISYLIFSQVDLLEKIVLFAAAHEEMELDELVSISMVFSTCMAIYAFRWWRASLAHNSQLMKKNQELQDALDEIKVLRGVIPICSYCKKIRDDNDAWKQLEAYLDSHSEAEFSHGICPDCYKMALDKEEA